MLAAWQGIDWSVVIWGLALFAVTALVSVALLGGLLVLLPATFFLDRHERGFWIDQHPVLRWTAKALKNALGAALILIGIVLSLPLVPGQGLLTILVGLMLVDFPGKRRIERRLIGRPRVLAKVNRWRARFGRAPLVLDEAGGDSGNREAGDS
jgi:hypothetical protein